MTCFPIFYAVIENDLRRVLAYSTINQLGFMVCGVGLGTALAIDGAAISSLDATVRAATLNQWSRMIGALSLHHGPQGILAKTWPTGSMVLWVAVLLGASLVLYYL